MIKNFTVAENMILREHHKPPYSHSGILSLRDIAVHADELIKKFRVKTPSRDTLAKNLSGGNIQKVVLAREFTNDADFLLIDQPTRGVDIGAQEAIHDEIMRQRAAGRAVLVISVQLDELLTLADRILVMFNGRIMGEVDGDGADSERIGMMMAGVEAGAATGGTIR
jgi:simple sugar transport system ATP-binding protein